jgi:hypothetical protein
MGAGGAAESFNRRVRAGADVEGAVVELKCDGSPASGVGIGTRTTEMRRRCSGRRGWESVHSTTLATLDEQSRCQVGSKNLFDRPVRDPHPLLHQVSPVGLAKGLHRGGLHSH